MIVVAAGFDQGRSERRAGGDSHGDQGMRDGLMPTHRGGGRLSRRQSLGRGGQGEGVYVTGGRSIRDGRRQGPSEATTFVRVLGG